MCLKRFAETAFQKNKLQLEATKSRLRYRQSGQLGSHADGDTSGSRIQSTIRRTKRGRILDAEISRAIQFPWITPG